MHGQKPERIALISIFFIAAWIIIPDLIESVTSTLNYTTQLDIRYVIGIILLLFVGWETYNFTQGAGITFGLLEVLTDKFKADVNISKKVKESLSKRNFCVAALMNDKETVKRYFSVSGLTFKENEKKALEDFYQDPNGVLCLDPKDDINIYPITRRLDFNVEWKEFKTFSKQEFAMHRSSCTERKILRQIKEDYTRRDCQAELKNLTLHINTKYEPCLYCVDLIREVKASNTFKEIFVYYPDMLLEFEQQVPDIHKQLEEEMQKVKKSFQM